MELKIDYKNHIPLYVQVEKLLRDLILKSEYQNGKLLPNETELSLRLGLSRNTVRAGIDKLVRDGILDRKRGVGTKVMPKKTRVASMGAWISFTKEMEQQGIKVKIFYSKFSRQQAPDYVIKSFSLPEKSIVSSLERVKGYKNIPVTHSLSYFHPRIPFTGKENFERPLYDIIEGDFHLTASNSFEKVTAVQAGKYLAGMLKISSDSPLLRRERIVTDLGGKYIEYNIHHQRSEEFAYTINIQRS